LQLKRDAAPEVVEEVVEEAPVVAEPEPEPQVEAEPELEPETVESAGPEEDTVEMNGHAAAESQGEISNEPLENDDESNPMKDPAPAATAATSASTPPKTKGKKSKRSSGGSSTRSNTISLISRLDMVASSEKLMDAIIALTEWVNKAASTAELKEFCTGTTTKALSTVISRALQQSEPDSITGQVLDLIGSILRSIGVSSTNFTSSVKTLGSAMRQARKTVALDSTITADVISTFCQEVLASISKTVEVATSAARDGTTTILSLESEIESMGSSAVKPTNGSSERNVGYLMTNRDHQKVMAEKYSQIVSISTQGSCGANGTSSSSDVYTNGVGSSSASSMINSFYGSQYEAFSNSKAQQESLEKRLAAATSSTFKERETITSSISAYTTEREKVLSRMDELKLELRQLESQDSILKERIVQSKAKLTAFEQSLSGEAQELENSLKGITKRVQVQENVETLVSNLEAFNSALGKSSSSTVGSGDKSLESDSLSKLTKNIGLYVKKVEGYFVAEIKLVDFLTERALVLEQKLPSLEHEIDECTALGMESNVTNMRKQLADNVQKINEDRGAVTFLREEAGKMRCDLFNCLEQCVSMTEESNVLNTSITTSLKKIQTCSTQMSLPTDARFSKFSESSSKPSANANMNGVMNGSTALREENYNGVEIPGHVLVESLPEKAMPTAVPTPVAAPVPAALPKKQGWGSFKPTTQPTKSLVEIQKEELSMK